jgi:hypothetical protein
MVAFNHSIALPQILKLQVIRIKLLSLWTMDNGLVELLCLGLMIIALLLLPLLSLFIASLPQKYIIIQFIEK